MTIYGRGLGVCIALCAFACSVQLQALGADLPGREIARQDALVLALQPKIKSMDVRLREAAFSEIITPLSRHDVLGSVDASRAAESSKRAVTELMSYEFGATPPGSSLAFAPDTRSGDAIAEELSNYVPALIGAVRDLHDPGSIPLLYNAQVLATGGMAIFALAYFGHREARRVFDLYLHAPSPSYRMSMEMVLVRMLYLRTLDDREILNRVEAAFLQQSRSAHASDRSLAVTGLSYFRDARARDRLNDIAVHDPWLDLPGLDHRRRFLVREEARIALRGPVDLGEMR